MRGDDPDTPHVNPLRLAAQVEHLVGLLRERLANGSAAMPQELMLYEDAVYTCSSIATPIASTT